MASDGTFSMTICKEMEMVGKFGSEVLAAQIMGGALSPKRQSRRHSLNFGSSNQTARAQRHRESAVLKLHHRTSSHKRIAFHNHGRMSPHSFPSWFSSLLIVHSGFRAPQPAPAARLAVRPISHRPLLAYYSSPAASPRILMVVPE